jgi:hypothetical protein
MLFIKNIAILIVAMMVGGTFSFLFAVARCGKAAIGLISKISVTTAAIGLSIFFSGYNIMWLFGITIGYVFGIFIISLCVASGEYDRRYEEEMRNRIYVE